MARATRHVTLNPEENPHLCAVCNETLDQAIIWDCGHTFCEKPCTEQAYVTSKKCPECRAFVQKLPTLPNYQARKGVEALPCRCAMEHCNWRGKVGAWERHIDACQEVVVPCPNKGCTFEGSRPYAAEHLSVCTYNEELLTPCALCKEEFPRCDLQGHMLDCSETAIKCPIKACEMEVRSSSLQHHMMQHTPATIFAQLQDALASAANGKVNVLEQVERVVRVSWRGLSEACISPSVDLRGLRIRLGRMKEDLFMHVEHSETEAIANVRLLGGGHGNVKAVRLATDRKFHIGTVEEEIEDIDVAIFFVTLI